MAEGTPRLEGGLSPLDAARDLAGGPYAGWGEGERLVVNLTALARDLGLDGGRRRADPVRRDGRPRRRPRLSAHPRPARPPDVLTYEEAAAAVTGPGERFEIETIDVGGVPVKAFKHAPPSLREIFATARDRGRRHLPRLRGRAVELRRGDGARRRAWPRCSSTATASRPATGSPSACGTTPSG